MKSDKTDKRKLSCTLNGQIACAYIGIVIITCASYLLTSQVTQFHISHYWVQKFFSFFYNKPKTTIE